jgi:hypothetical protein
MDDLKAMGLSARELKKLKAMMEREADEERRKSGGTKSRKRAPVIAPATDGKAPTALPPKKRPREGSNKRERAAAEGDFDAFCAATTPADLAKLNEYNSNVQTIFSLGGYRAFHRWRAEEIAAADSRASSNSLAALEAHGRAQAGDIDAEMFSARRSRTPP